MIQVQFGTKRQEKEIKIECHRQAWRAIQAGMPNDVIISSDIGNNCAIGNAYPTFEKGRKYLAPGLFGLCDMDFLNSRGKNSCPEVPVIGFARRSFWN